jgi:hypothetical protein
MRPRRRRGGQVAAFRLAHGRPRPEGNTAFFEARLVGMKALRSHDAVSNGTGGHARTGEGVAARTHNPRK